MSSARFGKWADADEDEDEDEEQIDASKPAGGMFATQADENGIKMTVDYKERDGKMYKVTKRVKETKLSSWTNGHIVARQNMKKFGKARINDEQAEKNLIVRSEEEIRIELSKKMSQQVTVKDEAEDKFYEESLSLAESMNQVKKSWTDANRSKQVDRDDKGIEKPVEPDKPSELREAAAAVAATSAAAGGPAAYVPPSLRGKAGADPKGKGKGGVDQSQEASLRVFNLSEDAKEGDLQDLFSSVGRLQRVYLAKDQETGLSRGFAFITYYTKEDAQKAINKLNGFGYDNLILSVQFAKPRE